MNRIGNPAALVESVHITTLAEAVAGTHPFAYANDYDELGGVRFRCPECEHLDHNGGTATVIDGWRWTCSRCSVVWTRYRLERHVLEKADYLESLYRLVEVRRVGA